MYSIIQACVTLKGLNTFLLHCKNKITDWIRALMQKEKKRPGEDAYVEYMDALMGTPSSENPVLSRVLFHSSRTIRCISFTKINSPSHTPLSVNTHRFSSLF